VDPAGSAALFDQEVAGLAPLAMFNGGGLVIESATYPDLVVVLPHPSGKNRRFRLRADGWNELPPSVQPIDANGIEVRGEPTGGGYWTTLNGTWGFCVPGTREYHQHHGENPWSNHRGSTTLATVVGRLYYYYRLTTG
jgi:hypothetical protein